MNGYYKIVIEILKEHGYRYYRNGKGSHEIWIKRDAHGKLTGRVQIPTHLADKHFAQKLLRDIGITDKVN